MKQLSITLRNWINLFSVLEAMNKTYRLFIQGNDTLRYESTIEAESLEAAIIVAQVRMKTLAKNTIEQFISITIAELFRK